MNTKLLNVLEDLLVALGLRERPQAQPIPVRSNPPRDPRAPGRHR
ncbi:hypothetical protein SAMN05216603_12070 [Pseudomonas benzenivorans]|nr:PA1414 family protein [Pseudomonas benzenivorans]SDI07407.1 hypothetical protein SAMN05216603_12070 [Pseudomonas benzenivorans]